MPDQYGNPTEAELRGQQQQYSAGYTPYTPDMYAAIAAQHAAAPKHDNSPNAPSFQPANPNDPYYQRSDIAPFIQATNRDVLGGGHYGIRGWMNQHPVGTIAAFIAAAAGGAAATPAAAGGGSAAGAGSSGSGLGYFANGGMAGIGGLGSGNAGALAASGGITGGAGTGFMGSLGGSGLLSSNSIKNAGQLNRLLGSDSGGQQMPYTGFGSNYGQPTQQQQQQPGMMGLQPRILPSMNQPLQPYGRRPYKFNGATVWI